MATFDQINLENEYFECFPGLHGDALRDKILSLPANQRQKYEEYLSGNHDVKKSLFLALSWSIEDEKK